VILTGMTHSHAARLESFRLGALAMQDLTRVQPAKAGDKIMA
jgi:hypothetical protein